MAMSDQPILSVVVIGRNEGARLTRCLESVLSMDPPGGTVEIIYVDTASIDGSADRARCLGAYVIEIDPKHPCASVARNVGSRVAHAGIVLFLDGDTILDRGFAAGAISQFDDPKIAVVFGDLREIDADGSIYNSILDLDWLGLPGPAEFCGGNALIRRDVLDQAGGFDERLIAAEDTELCSRIRALGYTVMRLDRPMAGHDLAMKRFSQYWRRAVRTGYAYAQVSEKIRPGDSPVWYRQARRNRTQGAAMLAIVAGSPILSIAIGSIVPVLVSLVALLALSIRTAKRSHWRRVTLSRRLLHGLHSHLVQIPLFIGQMKYLYNRTTGRTERLIEYKDVAAADRP